MIHKSLGFQFFLIVELVFHFYQLPKLNSKEHKPNLIVFIEFQ